MYRLVRELVASGVPVIATTTTRILEPAEGTMPEVALGEGNASHIEVLRGMVEGRGFALTGSSEADGKITGHSPEFLDSVRLDKPEWAIVSECDGARGKSLKVPDAHEPPLPSLTNVYVVVVGADCLGERVDSAAVYNPEAVASVAGVPVNALVDDSLVAATVLSPESYLGRKPAGARLFVLVNKVNPGDVLPAGDRCTPVEDNPVVALASRLLSSGDVAGVVIGSVGRASGEPFAVLR
jgi:probable selenium-dependent hydroxylase accessory protein YqeC